MPDEMIQHPGEEPTPPAHPGPAGAGPPEDDDEVPLGEIPPVAEGAGPLSVVSPQYTIHPENLPLDLPEPDYSRPVREAENDDSDEVLLGELPPGSEGSGPLSVVSRQFLVPPESLPADLPEPEPDLTGPSPKLPPPSGIHLRKTGTDPDEIALGEPHPDREPDHDEPYVLDSVTLRIVPMPSGPPPAPIPAPELHPVKPIGLLAREEPQPPTPPAPSPPVPRPVPAGELARRLWSMPVVTPVPPAAGEPAPPELPPDPHGWQLISLVIPVFNEEDSLQPLHAEIDAAVRGLGLACEIIFVDDGSSDGSWSVVQKLAANDRRVRGLRLRANFGKAAALAAGFQLAGGEVVMTLDADLQDDPKEIPRFLAALRAGFDVVSGWKKIRLDPWHKTFPSRVFNAIVGRVTGVRLHDHNCGFKAYRAQVLREVQLYGELHRFVPVLAAGRGFRVGELVINHRPRKYGHSKYGWRRFVKGLLDLFTVRLLTGFGRRPQHLLGSTGLLSWSLGVLLLMVLGVNALVRWDTATAGIGLSGQILLGILSLGAFLFGTQMLLAGLTAEFFVARSVVDTEPYGVADHAGIVGTDATPPPTPSEAIDLE